MENDNDIVNKSESQVFRPMNKRRLGVIEKVKRGGVINLESAFKRNFDMIKEKMDFSNKFKKPNQELLSKIIKIQQWWRKYYKVKKILKIQKRFRLILFRKLIKRQLFSIKMKKILDSSHYSRLRIALTKIKLNKKEVINLSFKTQLNEYIINKLAIRLKSDNIIKKSINKIHKTYMKNIKTRYQYMLNRDKLTNQLQIQNIINKSQKINIIKSIFKKLVKIQTYFRAYRLKRYNEIKEINEKDEVIKNRFDILNIIRINPVTFNKKYTTVLKKFISVVAKIQKSLRKYLRRKNKVQKFKHDVSETISEMIESIVNRNKKKYTKQAFGSVIKFALAKSFFNYEIECSIQLQLNEQVN